MKFRKWDFAPTDEAAVTRLKDAGFSPLLSLVLASRGINSAEEASPYLEQERNLSHSPRLMKDMDKAVARIERAVADGETVAVFGDYDVDGITATCVLKDYLTIRGLRCLYYIPRREEDGYGLSREPIRALAEQGATLLITVDCGITGADEIDFARSCGMDVIVTDHHECKERLPDAVAVVDPHRPDCPYPFKQLAGVGVALKLVLALAGESREEAVFSRYCSLAAIGTVADVMEMNGENRVIVRRGLEALHHTDFLGIHALLQEAGLAGKPCTSTQIGFVLAPRLNAAGRMGEADLAVELLLSQDAAEAELLAKSLCELNHERQSVEREIFESALAQAEELPLPYRHALVLYSDSWHQGVVGIVSSRLTERFSCPSFLIRLGENGMGKGSCRSYGGFNLFSALEACADILEGFGGHELAAGFTIRQENIPAFRERMNEYVRIFVEGRKPVSCLSVDARIDRPGDLCAEGIQSLDLLEPYGAGNRRPVFALCGVTLDTVQSVGQNRHLKLQFTKGQFRFHAIYFSMTEAELGAAVGARVDIAFYAQMNDFRGSSSVQLQLIDLRPSLRPSKSESDALDVLEKALALSPLSPQESAKLNFTRDQAKHLWHAVVEKASESGPLFRLPLYRSLALSMGGADAFLRTAFCMEVFRERGLISLKDSEEEIVLRIAPERRVVLEDCPFVCHVREQAKN